MDLEALAEGADTGIHNADFVSKQPVKSACASTPTISVPVSLVPFHGEHGQSWATALTERFLLFYRGGTVPALRPWSKSAFPFTSRLARQSFLFDLHIVSSFGMI